jgi:two-component system LytT family response regulator
MLRTLVVDDERHARETLTAMIDRYCAEASVVAAVDSAPSGLEAIRLHHPDLVLLDVEMLGGSGFELLEAFPDPKFKVIFVTAHDHYAIRAIKFAAIDYILKPVSPMELKAAIARARNAAAPPADMRRQAGILREQWNDPGRLAVPTGEGFIFVDVHDVVRCHAEGNYTTLHLAGGAQIVSCRTLGDYESILADAGFFRVHHSHLINLAHARRYRKGKGGVIVMSDGAEVDVSVRKREAFLDRIAGI